MSIADIRHLGQGWMLVVARVSSADGETPAFAAVTGIGEAITRVEQAAA